MNKISKISGFPEWLPGQQLVQEEVIGRIKKIFNSYGYTPVETPAVELTETLLSKGEISQEIYGLYRLQGEKSREEAKLALHYDLTVPFARYAAQHFSDLTFPFKRCQLQKVWRGERPQEGRFREFYQFDIDVIARDVLPLCFDAEIADVVNEVLAALPLGSYTIKVNNRKILFGLYGSLGLSDKLSQQVIGVVDKKNKLGMEGIRKELGGLGGISVEQIESICGFTDLAFKAGDFNSGTADLKISHELFEQGCRELDSLVELLSESTFKNTVVDFSLARGLDYYTGTIIEASLNDYPEFGSVCGGGRYDDLASQFIRRKLPGVGVSIGLTRLMSLVFSRKLLDCSRSSPSQALITVYSEQQRKLCNQIAARIRASGTACEVFCTSSKLGKQIEYADKKGIRYVIFISSEDNHVEVKDLETKKQIPVDLEDWCREMSGR